MSTEVPELDGAERVRTRQTTQQLVHDVLRESILSGQVEAGARLIQDEIATQFRVSRIPVREALLQLQAEGLIVMEAHRGARVVVPSIAEIRENLEIRKLLLLPTVRASVPLLSDDHLIDLRRILDESDRPTSSGSSGGSHAEFYTAILAPVDSPQLIRLIVQMERQIERFCQGKGELRGHTQIVEACEARDGGRAAGLIERHMERFTDAAISHLLGLRPEAPDGAAFREARPR